MTGLLLGLIFAAGVGCFWFGVVVGVQPTMRLSRRLHVVHALLADAGLGISVLAFVALVAGGAVLAGLVVWWIVGLPAFALAAIPAGGAAPVLWARSRRERRRLERERAWPAALAQLADALEAGLAWPAAVGLVARSGPEALRDEWVAFAMRLRGESLAAAVEGLRRVGERTADSVALLLQAALLELPMGGLAPVLRELSTVLGERLESREKARSRAASIHTEAAVLALSPVAILLLIGWASPGYLSAYKSLGGTIVLLVGGAAIAGCYALMRRLGGVPEPRRTGRAAAGGEGS